MAEKTLRALEFPEFITILQNYARSEWGRRALAALSPAHDFEEVKTGLQEVTELEGFLAVEGPCPLEGFPDLAPLLERAKIPGSLLHPGDFGDIITVLRLVRRLRRFFAAAGERHPLLAARAASLAELPELRTAILEAISPHGLILDNASAELKRIREDLAATRHTLTRRLQHMFFQGEAKEAVQDQIIAQRNGRYVIPIRAEYKGRFPGIIHDQSQSRATLFIEPLEVVDLNNNLNLLAGSEKREEERILRHLTDIVRAHQDPLVSDLHLLAHLDVLHAKVLYAQDYKARVPELSRSGRFHLFQARHPLLLAKERSRQGAPQTIPVDLSLNPEQRFLILSGANTGGKTATLKTLGLLCLMVQSGIPIPVAEGSVVTVFDQIFADIGDAQDLANDLSTFSAHIKRLQEIMTQLQGRSLVLLDELGTATDPGEGAALATAVVKHLLQTGAYGAVTTHYHMIKAFAEVEPGCVNVALLFDEQTHRPLYRLAYGVAGPSNALEIARDLGLPPEIIAAAEDCLGQEGLEAGQLLSRLQTAQQTLAQRQQDLEADRRRLDQEQARLDAARATLEAERRQQQEHDRKAIMGSIRQAERQFKDIFRRLEHREESWGRLRQEFSRVQGDLEGRLPPEPQGEAPPGPQAVPGQRVFLANLGRHAVVTAGPDRDGRVEVLVGTVKVRLPAQDLKPAASRGQAGPAARSGPQGTSVSLPSCPMASTSLNIIGLRVAEALPLVDRLLDQAVLNHCPRVDIIHGIGTGRLQSAVRQHLKQHVLVKDFQPGEAGQGNPGVTTVEIKE